MDQSDALGAYNFQVEVDGVTIAQFKEVSGLSTEIKVIEHEEVTPGGKPVVKKIPGPKKWGDITLKRGKTDDADGGSGSTRCTPATSPTLVATGRSSSTTTRSARRLATTS